MTNYKAIITTKNGSQKNITVSKEEVLKHKNISNLIFNKYENQDNIKSIDVELWNENTKKYYQSRTYDDYLEQLRDNNNRVEITFNWGENTIEKSRCYIGKSTGWIPSYLEIKKSNSTGGGAIITRCIESIRIIR